MITRRCSLLMVRQSNFNTVILPTHHKQHLLIHFSEQSKLPNRNSILQSFDALFFGDKEHGRPIRLIPSELFVQVKIEHRQAMLDPVKYMQEFNYKQPVSIPQLYIVYLLNMMLKVNNNYLAWLKMVPFVPYL